MSVNVSYRIGLFPLLIIGLLWVMVAYVLVLAVIAALALWFLWLGLQWIVYGWQNWRASRPEPYSARHR